MKSLKGIAGLTKVLVAAVGCLSTGALSPGFAAEAKTPPFRIVLANAYIGNTWRIEMENEFKAATEMAPYKDLVKAEIFNSGASVPIQLQQLDNIINSKPDAILIDGASPTSLNGVVERACKQGILVLTFDNIVTAPCAIPVSTDPALWGRMNAEFIAKELNGKGNVVMITGVPGETVDTERNKAADAVWAQHPSIKVIARAVGMWDSATTEQVISPIIASNPQIDAVWVSAGTDGAINALVKAGRKLPVVAGEGENGFAVDILKYKDQGFRGQSIGNPPYLSVMALAAAVEILQGKRERAEIKVPYPVVTSDNVAEGKNAFPDLPGSFFSDFTGPDVPLCPASAVDGAPCPGELKVNLH
jgi:ribose transport system substrate-binding protein